MMNEQKLLNGLLRNKYKLNIAVQKTIPTPDYNCMMLAVHPSANVAQLKPHLEDIGNMIYSKRVDSEPVTVNLVAQPAHLQISRPDRQKLTRPVGIADNHCAALGGLWKGPKGTKVQIDLTDAKNAHTGIFSSSGGGKSILLNSMILSLCEGSSPHDTQLFLIDLESNQFDKYSVLPHVQAIGKNDDEALDIIEHLRAVVEADRDLSNRTRMVLVIDELQILTQYSSYNLEIIEHLEFLAQTGRKHGMNLWLATQDPTGDNFPRALQKNNKVTIAGYTEDDSYLKRYFNVTGVSALRGDGDFIIRAAGKQDRFKSFWLDDRAIDDSFEYIHDRWGSNANLMQFETVTEAHTDDLQAQSTDSTPIVIKRREKPLSKSEQKLQEDAAKLSEIIQDVYNAESGDWINKTAALDHLGMSNSGHNYKKLDKIVQLINFDNDDDDTTTTSEYTNILRFPVERVA